MMLVKIGEHSLKRQIHDMNINIEQLRAELDSMAE